MSSQKGEVYYDHGQHEDIGLLLVIVEKVLIVKAADNLRGEMHADSALFSSPHRLKVVLFQPKQKRLRYLYKSVLIDKYLIG